MQNKKITEKYAHDFRDMKMSEIELEAMLTNYGKELNEDCNSDNSYREKDTIYKLIKHWNLEGDQEAELRDFINQQLETQKQEIIGVIDEIYKKEQGIHNWLELRSFILRKK